MAVSITKKPQNKVSNLTTPKRETGYQAFSSSWKLPSSHTKDTNNARATNVEVQWQLNTAHDGKPWISRKGATSFTSDTLQLNQNWKFSNGKRYNRQEFYPYRNNRLYEIIIWVREYNSKGNGPWNKIVRTIDFPKDPVLSYPEMSEAEGEAGNITCEVKWDKGNDGWRDAELCDVEVYVTDTTAGGKRVLQQAGTYRSEAFTLTYDAINRMKLDYDGYIRVEFEAQSKGWRGNSNKKKRQMTVSYPREATIQSVDISGIDEERGDGIKATNKVTVHINTNSNSLHPVTGCVLERLVGTNAKTIDEAVASNAWDETGAKDDGQCTALAVAAEDLLSGTSPGTTVWVRVKSWNTNSKIFYRYSKPWRVTQLETPAAGESSAIKILSLIPGADGESAVVQLGWDDGSVPSGTTAGTELTWAEDEYAWQSTAMPSSYEVTLDEGPITHEGTTYPGSAKIYIRNLKQGTKYYVRARRYYETDAGITYSTYAGPKALMPVTAPRNVTLTAPAFIPRGDSLAVSWGFDSEAPQTSWNLLKGTITSTVDDTQTPPVVTETFTPELTIASGEDALGSYIIDADRLSGLLMITDEDGNPVLDADGNPTYEDSIALAVEVSTGGDVARSTGYTVKMADKPELTITTPETLTAQPLSISAECNEPCEVALVVTSHGIQGDYPDGVHTQVEGDTVFSDVFMPEWVAGIDTYTAQIALPTGLDFYDGATYAIACVATSGESGLSSDRQEAAFSVAWAHQASIPPDTITVTPNDVTDEEGFRRLYAEIQLVAPAGAAETDLYDVYRVTADGPYLIARDVALDGLVTDYYAPYGDGEHAYRVALRTADGDVEWTDYPYELACNVLRIDFNSQYIELPWNLTVGDAYTKDFEARAHLGSDTPQGYWNENITRQASFSTDVLRIQERSQIDTLHALARYAGSAFVRTPNGSAYQANIDVSGLDETYNSGFVAVALDGQEIGLTEAYWAIPPEVLAPDDEE